MYCKYFGFNCDFFGKEIEVEDFFVLVGGCEFEIWFGYFVELWGIGFVIGDFGSGKICVCCKVVVVLYVGFYCVVYVLLLIGNVMDFYKIIFWELGLFIECSCVVFYCQICNEVMCLVMDVWCWFILIVDEVYYLWFDVLEDLCLLINYQMDVENCLCFLFVGYFELCCCIGMVVYEVFNQCIVVCYYLFGLLCDEFLQYFVYFFWFVGMDLLFFELVVIEVIVQMIQGLFCKVNFFVYYVLFVGVIVKIKVIMIDYVQIVF